MFHALVCVPPRPSSNPSSEGSTSSCSSVYSAPTSTSPRFVFIRRKLHSGRGERGGIGWTLRGGRVIPWESEKKMPRLMSRTGLFKRAGTHVRLLEEKHTETGDEGGDAYEERCRGINEVECQALQKAIVEARVDDECGGDSESAYSRPSHECETNVNLEKTLTDSGFVPGKTKRHFRMCKGLVGYGKGKIVHLTSSCPNGTRSPVEKLKALRSTCASAGLKALGKGKRATKLILGVNSRENDNNADDTGREPASTTRRFTIFKSAALGRPEPHERFPILPKQLGGKTLHLPRRFTQTRRDSRRRVEPLSPRVSRTVTLAIALSLSIGTEGAAPKVWILNSTLKGTLSPRNNPHSTMDDWVVESTHTGGTPPVDHLSSPRDRLSLPPCTYCKGSTSSAKDDASFTTSAPTEVTVTGASQTTVAKFNLNRDADVNDDNADTATTISSCTTHSSSQSFSTATPVDSSASQLSGPVSPSLDGVDCNDLEDKCQVPPLEHYCLEEARREEEYIGGAIALFPSISPYLR
ncbi:uncharacterized protein EI97DRAFT_443200 [Westerdykella ornata]|uniref:Uncharacterized protein n=1 Tax=Westerdykella ornata TaxID=318751 RepID=A0A6A6JFZ0_WESOR|nr:uncharacterized protein EI97DRAFT_443200 [Westerdykella ornata]KAF2275332.1 hypothetical protein EI97DRAFT_443200 [Westerdykella ornata]